MLASHCVAGVVELVDTTDSKSVAFASVTVQVRPPVPFLIMLELSRLTDRHYVGFFVPEIQDLVHIL